MIITMQRVLRSYLPGGPPKVRAAFDQKLAWTRVSNRDVVLLPREETLRDILGGRIEASAKILLRRQAHAHLLRNAECGMTERGRTTQRQIQQDKGKNKDAHASE